MAHLLHWVVCWSSQKYGDGAKPLRERNVDQPQMEKVFPDSGLFETGNDLKRNAMRWGAWAAPTVRAARRAVAMSQRRATSLLFSDLSQLPMFPPQLSRDKKKKPLAPGRRRMASLPLGLFYQRRAFCKLSSRSSSGTSLARRKSRLQRVLIRYENNCSQKPEALSIYLCKCEHLHMPR